MQVSSAPDQDLLNIAYAYARHLGLPREESQECALDFRLHMLRAQTVHLETAWVHRCARNFACNYLRAYIRRHQSERRFSEQVVSRDQRLAGRAARGPGPRTLTLRNSFWEHVFATLQNLTSDQRELFIGYHLRQYSLTDLAQRTGRSLHAVEQSLYNIHRRLANLLQQQGWSAPDTQQLFSPSLPLATSAPHINA